MIAQNLYVRKLTSVVKSCKSEEQLESAINWIKTVSHHIYFTKLEAEVVTAYILRKREALSGVIS